MNAIHIIKRGDRPPGNSTVVYCGRGSPLGNPHVMQGKSLKERDRVCDLYAAGFPNAEQKAECDRIAKKLKLVPVALECFCAPLRCHCETIKSYLETHYAATP